MSFFWIRCLDKILNPFHAKFWWTYQSYIEVRSKKYFSSPNHPHADRRRPCWTRGPRASRRPAPEEGQTPATRACCWPSACLAPPPTYLCALTILHVNGWKHIGSLHIMATATACQSTSIGPTPSLVWRKGATMPCQIGLHYELLIKRTME